MAPRSRTGDVHAAAEALLNGVPLATVPAQAGFASAFALERALGSALNVAPPALAEWARTGRYTLDYHAPFHLEQTLRYLGRDAENLAERVNGSAYTRYITANGRPVLVTLDIGKKHCTVTAERPALARDALALHAVIRRFLGLEQPLSAFYRAVRDHKVFGPLTSKFPGVRIPQLPSLWEALCWAVVGQQINLAFAYKLRNRLIALGNRADAAGALQDPTPLPFPSPEQVLAISPEALRKVQFSRQKAAYVLGLARACADGMLDEAALRRMEPEAVEETLLAQKGLGPWSVAYALMRSLGHPDALPVGDTGLRTALQRQFRLRTPPDIKRQIRLMEPLRPYRSLASYYLWKSLSAPAGE